MNIDEAQWESLRQVWQSTPADIDASPLRKVVRAHRRRLMATVIGEVLMVLAFAALSVLVARDGIAAWEIVWLITLWSFAIVAVAFVIVNRRGTWSALGDSVADYVALTRLRALRQRQMIVFAAVLFIAEAMAVIAQLLWFDRFTLLTAVLLGASGIAVAAWCWTVLRRVKRDLELVRSFLLEP